MDAETGQSAYASQSAFSNLRSGHRVNGVVLAVTPSSCRIFKPATSRGAHKNWDDFMCDSAAIVKTGESLSFVGLFGDGRVRAYSIPALKEISSKDVTNIFDIRKFGDARISPSGDVLGWTGPSELAMLNVWGAGLPLYVEALSSHLAQYILTSWVGSDAAAMIFFSIPSWSSHRDQQYRTCNGFPEPSSCPQLTWTC